MSIKHEIAQYRAYRNGVVHTTLNPKGPGAVRIHLVPPKWRPFSGAPYVLILNGYYFLPLGYAWAVLLNGFIREINRYDGIPMTDADMDSVMEKAVESARRVYGASRPRIRKDLEEMLEMFCRVARGGEPEVESGMFSLREYAGYMTAPHRMDLMISSMLTEDGRWNCNLKCQNCYAAGQEEAGRRQLSTEDWKKIIDKCRAAGISQLTFTGGEPTMREDLPELVAYASWFVTRLNTNGVRLTKELCQKLKEASLDSVQITLYSSRPQIHDKLVGAGLPGACGGFVETVAGLENALAAGLNVSVNTPLCGENKEYIETLAFLAKKGVSYVTCSGLIETGKADPSFQISIEEMDGLLAEAAAFCGQHEMELSFTSPGRATPERLREAGIQVPMCGACLSNMAIGPDGSVVPCQSWLAKGSSLGNMLTHSWRRIWNSESCKRIRRMSPEEALQCPLRKQRNNGAGRK